MVLTREKPDLPPNTATPTEVRDFLVGMLVSTSDLSTEHARCIADCWRLGSGRELRTYQAPMYRYIFGGEEGWIVYKVVKVLVHAASRPSLVQQEAYRTTCFSAFHPVHTLCSES